MLFMTLPNVLITSPGLRPICKPSNNWLNDSSEIGGGNGEVTEIGRWREKKDDKLMSVQLSVLIQCHGFVELNTSRM